MNPPLVSVIIPAYKYPELLLEAVQSVLAQDLAEPIEVIVVDDESPTDLRGPLLAHYPQVVYLRRPNGGSAAARQDGSERASGRYLAYLDHDDLWLPGKLSAQVRLLEENPQLDWAFCDAFKFANGQDQNYDQSMYQVFNGIWSIRPQPLGATPGEFGFDPLRLTGALFEKIFPVLPSVLIVRREFLHKAGGWNVELRSNGEDIELMTRLAYFGQGGYQDRALARIRRHYGGNQSDDLLKHDCKSQGGLEQAYPQYPPGLKRIVGPLMGRRLANLGWMAFEARQYALAFHYYSRALRRGFVRPAMLAKWTAAGLRAWSSGNA